MPEVEEQAVPMADYKASRTSTESPEPAAGAQEIEEQIPTEQDSDKDQRKPSRGGFQDRIDKLTREKYDAIRKHNEQLEENVRLTREIAKKTASAEPTVTEADPDPEPQEDDFSTYSAFTKAQATWAARQVFKDETAKRETQSKVEKQRERDKEIVDGYYQRVEEFRGSHPDFKDVVDNIRIAEDNSLAVQAAIFADEHGPEVAYYLGQHPEICDKLGELPMPRALALIGRISEQFDATESEDDDEVVTPPAPKPKKVSLAPEPISPVGGRTRATAGPIDEASMKDYKKARAAGRG